VDNPTRDGIKENLLSANNSSSGVSGLSITPALFNLNERDMIIKNSYACVGFVLSFTVSVILVHTLK
jgi:hypothetical protein